MPKKKAIEKPKPAPKPAPKPVPSTTDCFVAHTLAKKIIRFYKENKGIFSKDKYLIKNKKDLEEKIQYIKKILNDPRCENVKTTPPFRPFLEEALKLHLEKQKPKPAPNKQQLDEDIKDLYKYLKKSYEKNKPKLDKMTPVKYKNAIKRQNNKFLTEFKEIFQDNRTFIHVDDIKEADKRFYQLIPAEKESSKK